MRVSTRSLLQIRQRLAGGCTLKGQLASGTELAFDADRIISSSYCPFSKEWLYFDWQLNERVLKFPRFFPHADSENLVIGVSASESRSGYSVLMTDVVPKLHAVDMVGSQYFPMYVYDGDDDGDDDEDELFTRSKKKAAGPVRRDGITDAGVQHFCDAYPGEKITKKDVFDVRLRHPAPAVIASVTRTTSAKNSPRIPRVKTAKEFWAFSQAGKQLGDLHVGYEAVAEYKATINGPAQPRGSQLRVNMKFGKGKDKTVIHYNDLITVRDIPLEAYDYVVNGKPAIEWVMERQAVTTDKASGIMKDANALGDRDRAQRALSAFAPPSRDHGEPRDHEDRARPARARYPR